MATGDTIICLLPILGLICVVLLIRYSVTEHPPTSTVDRNPSNASRNTLETKSARSTPDDEPDDLPDRTPWWEREEKESKPNFIERAFDDLSEAAFPTRRYGRDDEEEEDD